ncbi:hypothetical protein AAAX56_11350, partial [Hominicoprocola fusiformis]
PSHYNKNKHSLRGFISASGAMLILYQTKNMHSHLPSLYNKKYPKSDGHKSRPTLIHTVIFCVAAVNKSRSAGMACVGYLR